MDKILTQLNGKRIEVSCEQDLINLSIDELIKLDNVMDIHFNNFGNEFPFQALHKIVKDKVSTRSNIA